MPELIGIPAGEVIFLTMISNIDPPGSRLFFKPILWFVLLLFVSSASFAEGSKDLYPNGVKGGRAFLMSTTKASGANPFPTQGEQLVYVKAGEWIAMASSMQGLNGSTEERIKLFDPNGNQVALDFASGGGNIPGRAAELAGPALPGAPATGSQYTSVYYQAAMDGIYQVQMLADSKSKSTAKGNYAADEDWVQTDNNQAIAAWDVSVCDQNKIAWINGRVFMYVVNFVINSATTKDYKGGFYGAFKILTNDGYVYKVDNNGMNGIYFTFMVNNRGFYAPNESGQPLYKSINANKLADIQDRYHDPRTADIPTTTTDKIFYNLPDQTMPKTALGGQEPGKTTWMRPTPEVLEVTDVSFTGAEGVPAQMGQAKGGYINFTSSIVGSYKLTLEPAGGASFTPRVLTGGSTQGVNQVYFDGKDGDGKPIPVGPFDLKIDMHVRFAEVHFPFIDVEVNPYGIIIELLKNDLSGVQSDTVYWDDEDIPTVDESTEGPMTNPIINLDGVSSNANGHKWGSDDHQYKGTNTFGDKMGMDTWTYLEAKTEVELPIQVKKADLKIDDFTVDKQTAEANDPVSYHVDAKNDGPSDVAGAKFTFTLPEGLAPVGNAAFEGNGCGTQAGAIAYDPASRTYTSSLDLPAGCAVSYAIKAKVTGGALPGDQSAEAAILRPDDVSDPDATNLALQDPNKNPYRPESAEEECANNGSGGNCNNMMSRAVTVVVMYAAPDINQAPEGETVTGNVLTNDKGTGLSVASATYLDENGSLKALALGSAVAVYDQNQKLAGKLTLHADGSYSFVPEADFKGGVTIGYTAKGKEGFSASSSLEVKMIAITNPQHNDSPVALNDAAYTIENIPVRSNVLDNDSDPDGDKLIVTGASQGGLTIATGSSVQLSGKDDDGNPVTGIGALVLKPDGGYTFIPKNGLTGTVNPISYKVDDGKGGTDSGTLFISVLKYTFNQTFANDDAASAAKGIAVKGNVLINDFDPEGDGQTVTAAAAGGVSLTIGTESSISGTGKLTISSDGSYSFKPDADFTGTLPVVYSIEDNGAPAAGSTATLYLTSLDVLTPPTANADEKTNQLLFSAVAVPATENDIPGNDGPVDPATISLTGPAGSTAADLNNDGKTDKVTVSAEGVWTVDASGVVTFTPESGFVGDPAPITYTVEDQGGLVSNETTVTITFNQTPPTATDDSTKGNTPGTPLSLNVTGNDLDNNGTGLDPATVDLSGPSGSSSEDADGDGDIDKVTVAGEGVWTVNATGEVTFTPDAGFTGDPQPIGYTVKDKAHLKSGTAEIAVSYNHTPPVANDDEMDGQVSGESVLIPVVRNDEPGNSGPLDPATVSLIGPAGSTSEDTNNDGFIDKVTEPDKGQWDADGVGNITFTPASNFMGDPSPVSYTVEDNGKQRSNAATVTVKTILGDNYFIANNFTPNGDGLNDTWKVLGNNIQEVYVMVYNQYGQKIFESRNKNSGWDGRYKGVIQPMGVYVYFAKIIFYDGHSISKKGSITLIR